MTLQLVRPSWRWLIDSDDAAAAVDREAMRWAGTPHRAGQATPGTDGGVDCIHFVAEMLEALYAELAPTFTLPGVGPLPRLAQDSGVHDLRKAAESPLWFKRRFPNERVRVPSAVDLIGVARPGDVFMVRLSEKGRANHAGIVAGNGRAVWHAGREGVVLHALGDMAFARRVARVYRVLAPDDGGPR